MQHPGQTTLTEQQAKAACSRFMSQWGPEDDDDAGSDDEPYDPYEFGDNDKTRPQNN